MCIQCEVEATLDPWGASSDKIRHAEKTLGSANRNAVACHKLGIRRHLIQVSMPDKICGMWGLLEWSGSVEDLSYGKA